MLVDQRAMLRRCKLEGLLTAVTCVTTDTSVPIRSYLAPVLLMFFAYIYACNQAAFEVRIRVSTL